jgi:hypothetical protein
LAADRRLRVLARLSSNSGGDAGIEDVCGLAVELAGVSGVGVMLMPGNAPQASLFTTNDVSRQR